MILNQGHSNSFSFLSLFIVCFEPCLLGFTLNSHIPKSLRSSARCIKAGTLGVYFDVLNFFPSQLGCAENSTHTSCFSEIVAKIPGGRENLKLHKKCFTWLQALLWKYQIEWNIPISPKGMKILTSCPPFMTFQCWHDPVLSHHDEKSYPELLSAVTSLTAYFDGRWWPFSTKSLCPLLILRSSLSTQGSYVHEWISAVYNTLH